MPSHRPQAPQSPRALKRLRPWVLPLCLLPVLLGCVSTQSSLTTPPITPALLAFQAAPLTDGLTYREAFDRWVACLPGTVEYVASEGHQILVSCKTPSHEQLVMRWSADASNSDSQAAVNARYTLSQVVVMRQFDQEYSGDELSGEFAKPILDALIANRPL